MDLWEGGNLNASGYTFAREVNTTSHRWPVTVDATTVEKTTTNESHQKGENQSVCSKLIYITTAVTPAAT